MQISGPQGRILRRCAVCKSVGVVPQPGTKPASSCPFIGPLGGDQVARAAAASHRLPSTVLASRLQSFQVPAYRLHDATSAPPPSMHVGSMRAAAAEHPPVVAAA